MRFLFWVLGVLLFVSLTLPGRAQHSCQSKPSPADEIVGRWYFPARQSTIEVYRLEGQYFARITDVNGPWQKGFSGVKGQLVLTNLTYTGGNWSGGELIHPQTGLHFDAALALKDPQTLVVTVYKGVRWVHKDFTLVRQPTIPASELAFGGEPAKK